MDDRMRDDVPEPGPQPDPLLKDGAASTTRTWAMTAAIAAVVLAVMYGVTTHRAEVKDEQRQSEMRHNANPAATVSPGVKPGG